MSLDKLFENFGHATTDYPGVMFYNIYKKYPYHYKVYFNGEGNIAWHDMNYSINELLKNSVIDIDCREFITRVNKIKGVKILFFGDNDILILGEDYSFLMIVYLSNNTIVSASDLDIYCTKEDIEPIFDLLKDCFVQSKRDEAYEFGIAAFNGSSIYTSYYDYTKKEIDINKNYNDDFTPVYDKICKLIEKEEETSLILFYGEPGTGKTSVIKSLISKYPEKEFIFIDNSILAGAPQDKLVSYFIENEDTVFILEDCEKALVSRDEAYNPIMNTLLNITDGIIGDVLGIKLICTFNTSLSKIDKALLRKGRLSLKYEFKKLKSNKVSTILNKEIKEDMTLADIYNIEEENDFSKKETRKMGF